MLGENRYITEVNEWKEKCENCDDLDMRMFILWHQVLILSNNSYYKVVTLFLIKQKTLI